MWFYNTNELKRALERANEAFSPVAYNFILLIYCVYNFDTQSYLYCSQRGQIPLLGTDLHAVKSWNIWQRKAFGGVPCAHLIFLQLRRNTERISTGNLQCQEICLYQVPVIPHYISNRLFKVVTHNGQHYRDMGQEEKYYRLALLEVSICMSFVWDGYISRASQSRSLKGSMRSQGGADPTLK